MRAMSARPRFGLKLAPMNCSLQEQREVWRVADQGGFDHLWTFDHLNPINGDLAGVAWEGWTLLPAMAEATSRVRIGCMVTGNTYRHPGQLAKMATTVDHLSGGRLEFGLGAAWAEAEHTMLGLEFPPVGERIRRLGEACTVLKQLWSGSPVSHDGPAYHLREAVQNPPPVQRPHPPIWIGGSGEKKTLRVVAEHADCWNAVGPDVEECRRKSEILDRHCETIGRDPDAIRRTVQVRTEANDLSDTVHVCETFWSAGFVDVILYVSPPDPVRKAEQLANELLPRFR